MKLSERLPDSIEVDGKRYKVDFSFRKVLKAYDIANNKSILPESRINAILRLLVKGKVRDNPRVVQAIFELLNGKEKGTGKPSFDFVQDAGAIYSAFRQTYGINLFKDDLSWFEFVELLSYLPDNTRLSQIISIRTREIPAPTKYNQKERASLIRLKGRYALSKDRPKETLEDGLKRLAESLLAMGERNG